MTKTAAPGACEGTPAFETGKWVGRVARALALPLAFGFVLAERGLPFLPWGKPLAIALTLALYVVGVSRLLTSMEEIALSTTVDRALAIAFIPLFFLVLAGKDGTPSMVALGAVIAAMVWNFGSLAAAWVAAGVVTGVLLYRALAAFGLTPGAGDRVDLLTGGELSSQMSGRSGLKIVVMILIAAGWQLTSRRLRERDRELSEARHTAERAADAERTAIARELHDVVAHHVSVMTLHAEGASAKASGPAKKAMLQVAESGRAALSELRRVLGVLRHGSEPAETGPQPGLGDLDELVERTTAAGIKVNLRQQGTPRKLDPGDELCAYRVAQEALTNVSRHSEASTVDLTLHWEPEALRVVVGDPGPTRSGTRGSRLGLTGMRERVELRGGTLIAERRRGGFLVDARIPTSKPVLTVAG